MKIINRGLFALVFTLLIQSQLSAEYLYKNNVINNPKFSHEVETLGGDLYKKTGIKVKLIMIKELPKDTTMYAYEKKILAESNSPTVLLTFSEIDTLVDIEANDKILYKYFNKKQILSPVTSYVQGFIMASAYAKSWDQFKEMLTTTGGTILPLLGQKSKKGTADAKYSAAMFNGYLDIAQQIAAAKGVTLGNGYDSDTNQETLMYVKIFFYGFVLYAIIMYIRRMIYRRRHKDEKQKQW
ncbi:3-dehydroquinate dehydratase [Sulfurimonas sp.]